MALSNLDKIKLLVPIIEKSGEDASSNWAKSYIFVSIYGALEQDIEDLIEFSLNKNVKNPIAMYYFEEEKLHRGLKHNDLKARISKIYKKTLPENIREQYPVCILTEKTERDEYDEYIELRHQLSHNPDSRIMSIEQIQKFLNLAQKVKDKVIDYIGVIEGYHYS